MARGGAHQRALHRYLGAGEHVVLETRQHPFANVGHLATALGWLTPIALAAWGLSGVELVPLAARDWVLRAAALAALAVIARLAWRVVGWDFERIVVTDEKVILLTGVLTRRIASTPLAKVSEFTVDQPLLGRIFGYGALVVDVPGGREQALHGLAYVPDPAGVYRTISDVARTRRTREGGGDVLDDARTQRAAHVEHDPHARAGATVTSESVSTDPYRATGGYPPTGRYSDVDDGGPAASRATDHTIELPPLRIVERDDLRDSGADHRDG